ncbi:MAG: response regulator transcription factor [Phenylobacterium sp.]|nr:MAG: response regulator transcription factor [Phenylobacterium sp.]
MSKTQAPAPTRLLVVAADGEERTFLRRRFTRLGYEVMAASDPAEALSLIETMGFEAVLLDLHLAADGVDAGFDLLRAIRAAHDATALPILAIAPETAAEDVNEALAQGANDCLLRPLYLGVAQARVAMLLPGRHPPGGALANHNDLQLRLEALGEAADRTEAVSAMVWELGHHVCAPLNALLGAATVLTGICQTPELKPAIETIETAAASIDLIIVRALGRADRRNRALKSKVRVLLADHDTDSRLAIHQLLDATTTEVELVEVSAGLDAALATDTGFFDLIMVNLAAPDVIAGIRAIRRAERENSTRRTPVLAFGAQREGEGPARDAGADLYVAEPVTAQALLTALAEALVRESEDVRAVA